MAFKYLKVRQTILNRETVSFRVWERRVWLIFKLVGRHLEKLLAWNVQGRGKQSIIESLWADLPHVVCSVFRVNPIPPLCYALTLKHQSGKKLRSLKLFQTDTSSWLCFSRSCCSSGVPALHVVLIAQTRFSVIHMEKRPQTVLPSFRQGAVRPVGSSHALCYSTPFWQ